MLKQDTKASTSLLAKVGWGICAYGWHLSHIMRGRPKYEHLADGSSAVGWFSLLWLILTWGSWQVAPLTESPAWILIPQAELLVGISNALGLVGDVMALAALWLVLLAISSSRRHSDSLFCAYLGASVGTTLLGLAFRLGGLPLPTGMELLICLIWMLHCRMHFFAMPISVRQSSCAQDRWLMPL